MALGDARGQRGHFTGSPRKTSSWAQGPGPVAIAWFNSTLQDHVKAVVVDAPVTIRFAAPPVMLPRPSGPLGWRRQAGPSGGMQKRRQDPL